MAGSDVIFIGVQGCVVALDRSTGQQVWSTRLKGYDFVTVVLEGGDLFAATAGEFYCVDPATGAIRWKNPLKGLGRGLISIAGGGSGQSPAAKQQLQNDEAMAAATVPVDIA